MRNLKRALSLTLASVMLLGMMVVGSSAAGYPDVSEEENIEAIEVLQTVGVMEGDTSGNFNPDDYVTREQMAVIMSKLLNLNYNYYQGTNPFSDVPAWAAPYVAACAANGITSGIGGGMYGAGQNVNAVQAALMMLKALGYFQYQDDFGDSYILATVKQATEVGMFAGIDSKSDQALTRNEVAQMALNALKADMVSFTGDVGTKIPTEKGDVVVGYRSEYTPRTSTLSKYQAIERRSSDVGGSNNLNRGQYYIQLGEELYDGDLVLHEYSDDVFMRPSRAWEYKGQEIGTYMKKENIRAEYTGSVSRRTLYDLLGRNNLQDYTFNYYEDGEVNTVISVEEILTRKTANFNTTGRGVLTQVFVDIDAKTIDIVSINTYLAKATVDYNTTTERVTLEVYSNISKTNTPVVTNTETATKVVSLADVGNIEGMKQDEFMLVRVSGKNNSTTPNHDTLAGYDVVTVSDVKILTDSELTKFSKASDSDSDSDLNQALFSSVTSEGTEYKSAKRAYYSDEVLDLYADDRLVNKTYNIYLDPYGNAIGIDLYAGNDNYVFITGVDLDTSSISMGTAKAAAIFVDGTMRTITVDVRDTNKNIEKVDGVGSYFELWKTGTVDEDLDGKTHIVNRWYTYTVDSNNEYTLNPAQRMITREVLTANEEVIKCNSVRIDEKASWADDTQTTPGTADGDGVNRYAAGKTGTRTYGNDDSVYIIVEAEESVSTSGTKKVISDVTGVYTGVQSVEIEVTGTATAGTEIAGTALYDSIYTLYDKNNYIIASVVLGEAKGGNASYVYTLTAATSEEKLSDGTHQWTFDAIVDGQITTLTARSKFAKTIKDLEPGHIQELRYDGDYVVGVKTPSDTTKYYTDPTNPIDDEEIYDVGHVAAKGAPDCTVGTYRSGSLVAGSHDYNGDGTNDGLSDRIKVDDGFADDLRVVGRTMYLGVGYDYGLTFVENAPAVVIQPEDDGTKKTEYSSVAAAIGALGDPVDGTPEKEYKGRIVAVLNSQGVAKWVVFVSDTPVLSSGVDNTNGNDRIVVDPNANTVEVTTVGDPDGIGSITSRIRKEMERLGYSEIVIEVNSDNEITKISGKRNGVTYTMKQLGAIRVLTPAEEVAEAKEKVTALPKNIDLDADDMIAGGEASARAAAKAAIKAAIEATRAVGDPEPADTVETENGFTLTFTWGAYTAPTTSDAGSIVITSVAIAKNGETETISNITFNIAKLTAEEQAEIEAAAEKIANQEAVTAAKTAIEGLEVAALTVENTADGIDADGIKTAIQSAVTTAADGVDAEITVTITKAAKNESANADDDTQGAGDGENGTFSISVALSKGEGNAAATGTATNAKGVITAKAYTKA